LVFQLYKPEAIEVEIEASMADMLNIVFTVQQ